MTREELIEKLDSFDLAENVADFILQLLSEQKKKIAEKLPIMELNGEYFLMVNEPMLRVLTELKKELEA